MTPLKVLFICTHNRCRSVLFEAITNQKGEDLLIAKSAGSAPAGEVHPLTVEYLTKTGYSTEGLSSNSWDDKAYMGDFEPDVLITVCDNAAGESCPLWLGQIPNLVKLHWGLSDPSKDTEDETQTEVNFLQTIKTVEQRVAKLIEIAHLPINKRQFALIVLKNSLSK